MVTEPVTTLVVATQVEALKPKTGAMLLPAAG